MVWMNHEDVLLTYELNIYSVTMRTVAMVTMVTIEKKLFWTLKEHISQWHHRLQRIT